MEIIEKPLISEQILEDLQTNFQLEQQVLVHCCFSSTDLLGSLIRIWKSTFLIDESLGHQSQLLHAENISLYPYWTEIPPMKDYWFTLIFSALPKNCQFFDLKEIIPEENGFYVPSIQRNKTDVYRVNVTI